MKKHNIKQLISKNGTDQNEEAQGGGRREQQKQEQGQQQSIIKEIDEECPPDYRIETLKTRQQQKKLLSKIRNVGPGGVFGEEEVMSKMLRKFDVTCETAEGRVVFINSNIFFSLIYSNPSCYQILTNLQHSHAVISKKQLGFVQSSLESYDHYLLGGNSNSNNDKNINDSETKEKEDTETNEEPCGKTFSGLKEKKSSDSQNEKIIKKLQQKKDEIKITIEKTPLVELKKINDQARQFNQYSYNIYEDQFCSNLEDENNKGSHRKQHSTSIGNKPIVSRESSSTKGNEVKNYDKSTIKVKALEETKVKVGDNTATNQQESTLKAGLGRNRSINNLCELDFVKAKGPFFFSASRENNHKNGGENDAFNDEKPTKQEKQHDQGQQQRMGNEVFELIIKQNSKKYGSHFTRMKQLILSGNKLLTENRQKYNPVNLFPSDRTTPSSLMPQIESILYQSQQEEQQQQQTFTQKVSEILLSPKTSYPINAFDSPHRFSSNPSNCSPNNRANNQVFMQYQEYQNQLLNENNYVSPELLEPQIQHSHRDARSHVQSPIGGINPSTPQLSLSSSARPDSTQSLRMNAQTALRDHHPYFQLCQPNSNNNNNSKNNNNNTNSQFYFLEDILASSSSVSTFSISPRFPIRKALVSAQSRKESLSYSASRAKTPRTLKSTYQQQVLDQQPEIEKQIAQSRNGSAASLSSKKNPNEIIGFQSSNSQTGFRSKTSTDLSPYNLPQNQAQNQQFSNVSKKPYFSHHESENHTASNIGEQLTSRTNASPLKQTTKKTNKVVLPEYYSPSPPVKQGSMDTKVDSKLLKIPLLLEEEDEPSDFVTPMNKQQSSHEKLGKPPVNSRTHSLTNQLIHPLYHNSPQPIGSQNTAAIQEHILEKHILNSADSKNLLKILEKSSKLRKKKPTSMQFTFTYQPPVSARQQPSSTAAIFLKNGNQTSNNNQSQPLSSRRAINKNSNISKQDQQTPLGSFTSSKSEIQPFKPASAVGSKQSISKFQSPKRFSLLQYDGNQQRSQQDILQSPIQQIEYLDYNFTKTKKY